MKRSASLTSNRTSSRGGWDILACRCRRGFNAAWAGGWDILLLAAAMGLVTFSLLEREGPGSGSGMDIIALSKVAIRMMTLAWFALVWFTAVRRTLAWQMRQQGPSLDRSSAMARFLIHGNWASRLLLPWFVYVAWAGVSVIWSPLKSFSFGQWLGLAALVLFAQGVALRAREHFCDAITGQPRSNNGTPSIRWQSMLAGLYIIGSMYCMMVLGVYLLNPQASGLDRDLLNAGITGFVHPTAAGATSSLTILLGVVIAIRQLAKRWWTLTMVQPINLAVLLLSSSRTALLMLLITLAICAVFLVQQRLRGSLLVLVGMILLGGAILAPGSEWLTNQAERVGDYVMRGQSVDQLKQVSGRGEMWAAVWDQFGYSPWIGHGYFVTSRTGELDVWGRVSNHDAHHVVLQVLVSTGVIGAMIFAWMILRAGWHMVRAIVDAIGRHRSSVSHADFLWCAVLLSVWYAGWSQTCISFLGPIRPESVIFFTVLGLLAAHDDATRPVVLTTEKFA